MAEILKDVFEDEKGNQHYLANNTETTFDQNGTPLNNGGDLSEASVNFTVSSSRKALTAKARFKALMGDIAKWLTDLGPAAFYKVADDFTTTAENYLFTARKGKQLKDEVDNLNQNLSFPDGVKFYPDVKDGIRGYNTDAARGADTFVPFRAGGITLLGKYTAISTYDLSGIKGYKNLIVDDFLCVSSTGGTSGSKYENDSNGTIQLSIGYTAPQLSYVASTGILTITPALLSGSAFHNPATATASGYLQTSVYLINK